MDDLAKQIKAFITKGNPSRNEIEIRFKDFYQRDISSEIFRRILSSCEKSPDLWKSEKNVSSDTVIVGERLQRGNPDVRRIETGKKKIVYQTKTRVNVTNIANFYFRLSEANETVLQLSEDDWKSMYVPKLQRTRERTSYTDLSDTWRLDATKVTTYNATVTESYEIELEYLKSSTLIGIDRIKPVMNFILSEIQNSKNILSHATVQSLMTSYSNLLGTRYPTFVGPLPYALTLDILNSGKIACGYSVTEKADGDRKLVFIGQSGNVLIISRPKDKNLVFQHVGFIPELENSIYDGEYISETNSIFLFDTLVYKRKDVRSIPLDHRLEKLNKMTGTFTRLDIKVFVKTFYMAHEGNVLKVENGIKKGVLKQNIYSIAADIFKNRQKFPYKLDGLIFTPINKGYYNKSIFKWKDSSTIDFFVQFTSSTSWQLYIAGLDRKGDYSHIPFEGSNADGIFRLKSGRVIEEIPNEIWKSDSDLKSGMITVSTATSKKFKTDTVIEFKYYGGKFLPMKTRTDKMFANNIRAVNDAWETFVNPITLSTLKTGAYKSCTRLYHNAIKNFLIQRLSSKKDILDIGSGAGGDIHKYIEANSKHVVGIDIVDVEYKYPQHMEFFKVNTELYSIPDIVKKHTIKMFDTINCHFAMHYFFKSKETLSNFILNINKTLKPGGHLVTTCMDGSKINELLKSNNVKKGQTYQSKFEGVSTFKIKKMYADVDNINSLKLYNQKVEINLCGTKYFKCKNSAEYIINFPKFIEIMKANGLRLVQNQSFDTMCKHFPYECSGMNSAEKQFSFMNSFLIFIKE